MTSLDLTTGSKPASRSVRGSNHVGTMVGQFHAAALLATGSGAIAAIAVLSIWLDRVSAVGVAVAINGAILAAAAIMAHRNKRDGLSVLRHVAASRFGRKAHLGFAPALALAIAAGALSWSYAIFFFDALSRVTGWSAVALAATLAAFLVGLVIGSRDAATQCNAISPEETMRRAAGALMKANVLGLLFLPVLKHLAWLDYGVLAVAVLMVFLAARFWGQLLPYLVELGAAADPHYKLRTAALYGTHTIGAGVGAILTGLWLLERLSIVAVAITLVLAGLVSAGLVVGAFALPRWQKVVRAGVIVAVALLALLLIPPLSASVLPTLH